MTCRVDDETEGLYLQGSNLKEYINREKIQTMKQMGGNVEGREVGMGMGRWGDISFSLFVTYF